MKRVASILLALAACAPMPKNGGVSPVEGRIVRVAKMLPPNDANIYQFVATEGTVSDFVVRAHASSGPDARSSGGSMADKRAQAHAAVRHFLGDFVCAEGANFELSNPRYEEGVGAWSFDVDCEARFSGVDATTAWKEAA